MDYFSKIVFLCTLATINGVAIGHEPSAHVHGVASLQVVHEGHQVSLEFTSPLTNLLGFEHFPRTAKQKQAVQEMLDQFQKPASLFVLTERAQCTAGSVKLTSALLKIGAIEARDKPQENDEQEHAELKAEMTYTCLKQKELKGLTAQLLNSFPGIHQLHAQVVGPRGQSAVTLTRQQRQLSW
jgi:hypothetical protein